MRSVAERLLEKKRYAESGCWEWTGTLKFDGYGLMRHPVKYVGAHRISYEIFRGPIPDGMQVLHRCDNRKCINPGHLFLGTNADNVADKVKKGRQRRHRGESNPNSKLSIDDVSLIRSSSETGIELARKYGVTRTCISDIRTGKTWGDACQQPST